ncbi:MAG: TolC family protein [Gammaproteobacteria bacterium]
MKTGIQCDPSKAVSDQTERVISMTRFPIQKSPSIRLLFSLALVFMLGGCGVLPRAEPTPEPAIEYPQSWERLPQNLSSEPTGQCGAESASLNALMTEALEQNLTLKTLRSQVEQARLGVTVVRADRMPSLSGALATTRRRTNANQFRAPNQQYNLGLDGQFEVDVWRRLSDAQRRAQLQFRSAQYSYENAVRVVLGDVAKAWYTAIFARELAGVFSQRVESVGNNLDIVEQAYRQGINTALDVYLARTSFAQEQARVARQRQTALESISSLQLLVTEYPSGQKVLDEKLPEPGPLVNPEQPTAILEGRPDVMQAWTDLLAQNAAVAVAHKERFPRLVIGASIDDLETEIGDILDGNNLAWSIVANLSQPIFQAGRLKALEAQARKQLEQQELAYIDTLQRAFGEVEDTLSNAQSLQVQINTSDRAADAANAAYELSFQQYQRGLTNYATVLQSEQRAFDTTSSLLELRYLQLINRIDLCTALGGKGILQ